jgi:hypothetical protein
MVEKGLEEDSMKIWLVIMIILFALAGYFFYTAWTLQSLKKDLELKQLVQECVNECIYLEMWGARQRFNQCMTDCYKEKENDF